MQKDDLVQKYIAMTCPNCGGHLSVSVDSNILKCKYCDNEFLVKRQSSGETLLQHFARCPRCNLNDRVEKITAIIRSQTKRIEGTLEQEKYYTDRGQLRSYTETEPFLHTEISVLAQRLQLPSGPELKPEFPKPVFIEINPVEVIFKVLGRFFLSIIVSVAVSFILALITDSFIQGQVELWRLFVIYFSVASIALFFIAIVTISKIETTIKGVKTRKQRFTEYRKRLKIWNEIHSENEMTRSIWLDAERLWAKLYYCSRDDCIFLPGYGTSESVTEMIQYIIDSVKSNSDRIQKIYDDQTQSQE